MVVIDDIKCKGCGDCVKICHESCMFLEDDRIRINYEYCSTCAQCIAICSKQALSWNGNPSVKFSQEKFPSEEQIDELLGQRRTIRFFKKDKPPRKVVEEIINYGMMAPSHHHEFRIINVDHNHLLEMIDKSVFISSRRIYRFLYKPRIIKNIIHFISSNSIRQEYERARPKLEKTMELGRAYSNIPPIIILIVGRKNLPLSIESAQYILYNMILLGMVKGIGSRLLVGNQMFLNRDRKLKNQLGISKKENIYGTLGIGYPSVKFRNKLSGRKFEIQWNAANY
jgi:nitroreductase/NAD-dependent dihydropyrimidine dehydrogenase PreA subunit